MHETKTHPDPLDVLATEFTARQRQGDCPTIEEYVGRYPELAEEIRELFPTIATLERMKVNRQRTPDGRVSLAGCQLGRLGDFRIVREVGRGGMGIVYEAEQQSLTRRVAVKVLPRQSLLEPKQLHRFQREAQTAAALHHTNIVPVFGVGQHDGFHYYVMQLIDGVGLDQVLDRLEHGGVGQSGDDLSHVVRGLLDEREGPSPDATHVATGQREPQGVGRGSRAAKRDPCPPAASAAPLRDEASQPTMSVRSQVTMAEGMPQIVTRRSRPPASTGANAPRASHWRSVARLGIQVADALHYAHAKGTLHRDIKPANLIVDRQDVVWVADFGLAKALECEQRSHSGDIVGTLAYMAPEQLRGRADHRSDIYSLGLTLYELLTLRPAFDQTDQAQLLERIVNDKPPRPRQVRPEIPRNLETIVLKAISREPQRRYASAAELAADLRCYLEDRPIQARRATAAERCWRWCRRNPVVAGLSATAVTLLMLVAVTASIGYAFTTTALASERTQRRHAEAATDVAVQVLDRVYERFAPPDVDTAIVSAGQGPNNNAEVKPVLSEGAAAVLEDLLVFYDRLAESGEDDVLYREKVASAHRRVGDIRHHLGQWQRAEAAYQQAWDLYRQIDQSTDSKSYVIEIATLQNKLGIMAHRQRRPDQARHRFQSNLEFLEPLAGEADATPQIRAQIVRAREFLKWLDDPGLPPPGSPGRHNFNGRPLGPHDFDDPPPGPHGFDRRPPGPPGEKLGPPGAEHPGFGDRLRDAPPRPWDSGPNP